MFATAILGKQLHLVFYISVRSCDFSNFTSMAELTFLSRRLTSMLISRFLLNLRQVAQTSHVSSYPSQESSAVISTGFSSIHVSTGMLGNLGAPLYSVLDTDTTEVSYEEKLTFMDEPFLAGLAPEITELRHHDVELKEVG